MSSSFVSGPRGMPGIRGHRLRRSIGLLVLGLFCVCGPPPAPRTSALLIVIDALRADHLGVYGHRRNTSPALDDLARRSVVFDRAFAQSSWTKPSVASIFTSAYPSQHRVLVERAEDVLESNRTTLAEVLRDAGYRTGGVSKNPHIQRQTGFAQGFDVFRGELDWATGDNDWVVRESVAFLESLDPREPFFLYVHFLDPHDAYVPSRACRKTFLAGRSTRDPRVRAGDTTALVDVRNGDLPAGPTSAADLEYLRRLYDAEICGVDAAIGALLDRLASLRRADDTVVLVTSDHGEGFLEHGRFKHGYDLFDEVLRIPLILHVPGCPARRETETLVQHIDIAPTLLDLLGVPAPDAFRGQSFADRLCGTGAGSPFVVAETMMRGVRRRALRTAEWKLVIDERTGGWELYDLERDPGEQRALGSEHAEIARELAEQLVAAAGPFREPESARRANGDSEIERALQALGYLD